MMSVMGDFSPIGVLNLAWQVELVRECDVRFSHGFSHIPNPSGIGWEENGIARPYLHRLAALRRKEAVTGDEMAQLRLSHLARPHTRRAFPHASLDLFVW